MIASNRIKQSSSRRGGRSGGALGSAFLLAVLAASLGCGKVAPPQGLSPQPPAAPPVARASSPPPEETLAPVVYQSKGRRDPFIQPRLSAALEPVLNLKVTGIVWGPRASYAVVESESAPGTGYVIRERDLVDSTKVLKITKESVIFEVQTKSADGKPGSRYVAKHIRSGDK